MTRIGLYDIFGFPQEIVKQYYLKICSEQDRESYLDTFEVWRDKVSPFLVENGVLEDLEQIRKGNLV